MKHILAQKHLLAQSPSMALLPRHSLARRRGLMSPAQSTGPSAMARRTIQARFNRLLLTQTLKEATCFSLLEECAVASSSSSALNLDQFHSVGMVCGLPDAKLNSGGGMTNSCVIKFTGTAASLLSARSSFGVSINGLLLEATNALFNGLIVIRATRVRPAAGVPATRKTCHSPITSSTERAPLARWDLALIKPSRQP